MKDSQLEEKESFQEKLATWLDQPLSYVKEKGYDLSEEWIARYQEFFDKQSGVAQGKNTWEEVKAIPREIVRAARTWRRWQIDQHWDTETAKELAEQDCIDRVAINLSIVDKALAKQAAKDSRLQKVLIELKKDTNQLTTLVVGHHHYRYLVDDPLDDE